MADFKHRLVVGISGHGKTYKMMEWARRMLASAPVITGQIALVAFSPTGDTWPEGVITCTTVDDLEAVLLILNRLGIRVILFVDEFVVLQDETKARHTLLKRLGPAGRHYGITLFAASQYPTSIHHRVRWNCSEAYVFRLASLEHAQDLWTQYGCQSLRWEVHEVDAETGQVGRKYMDMVPAWELITQLPQRCHIIFTSTSVEYVGKPFPVVRYKRKSRRSR